MKLVMLLLPMPGYGNKEAFMSACVKDCLIKSELPVSTNLYEWCGYVSPSKVTQSLLQAVEKVVVYDNFEMTDDVEKVLNAAVQANKVVEHRMLFTVVDVIDSLDKIISEICNRLNVSRRDLASKSRKRELVEARMIYFRRARETVFSASLLTIGKRMNRDHATVLHGIKIANEVKEVANKYNQLYARKTPINYSLMATRGTGKPEQDLHPGAGPVLSHCEVEERKQRLQETKPAMCRMS